MRDLWDQVQSLRALARNGRIKALLQRPVDPKMLEHWDHMISELDFFESRLRKQIMGPNHVKSLPPFE